MHAICLVVPFHLETCVSIMSHKFRKSTSSPSDRKVNLSRIARIAHFFLSTGFKVCKFCGAEGISVALNEGLHFVHFLTVRNIKLGSSPTRVAKTSFLECISLLYFYDSLRVAFMKSSTNFKEGPCI